ncbi:unnamed protein product [Ectocarpus sp. 12 AP-2014]
MASLNPPIADDLSQLALPRHAVIVGFSAGSGGREVLLARRDGMHLDLTVPTVGRFRTTGDAFLTTDRVVFCARKPHGSQNAGMLFKGFDIPFQVLSGEKFEQPILFGANNLSGVVETNVAYAGSTTGATAPGFHATATPVINSSWRLSFRNGGFGTFLHAFYSALQRRRSVDPSVTAVAFAGSEDEWVSLQATEVAQAVALDPTDGTVLLTAAPVAASAPPGPYGDL